MTTTHVQTIRRRRRSGLVAEPHVIQRRGSARFHPISNIFGVLDNEPIGVDETTALSHHNFYSSTPKVLRGQLRSYSIEGGWTEGYDGRLTYVETGRIEEVNDTNEDNDTDNNDNNTTADIMTTPRPLPSLSSPADLAGKRNTFGIPITEPLPPSTTPPPCPRLNRLSPQLFSSSSGTAMEHQAGTSKLPFTATSVIQTSSMPASVLDTGTEIALLQENLNLLATVYRDLQNMCTWFFAQTPHETFSDHIDCCSFIEEFVQSILASLNGRRRLGEEEWNVRSSGWHEKYSQRLYSLRRTLLRFLAIRPTIERRKMKTHHITLVLEKLKQHQLKLADISTKFTASFERLRLRHIHYLLTKAHSEARRKEEARRIDEASFERQWFDDKAIRADLRKEFYAHRTTRQRATQ